MTSTSEAPTMTQAAIRQLVVDSVATALETQAATMENVNNANRNLELREAPIARNNYTEDCKVKFTIGTLTEEALSWWNSFAQPIRIEEAYKITWVEFMKLLIKKMPPKRTSTSEAPTMTQAAIRQLVVDSVATALEIQAATMENADNANRNLELREAPIARNNYIEDCKVKFTIGTLTEEALSWWNSFAQPIRIEEAYKITWVEFMKLLIKKYCPRTEIQKMED
nr:reverse transcriptase domain-containing protein [Tanacetum cinerariifolium]